MEKQLIRITAEENEKIYMLFSVYMSYMSMLEYLSKSEEASNTPVYERKWDEAASLWIELEKAKQLIEKKYKPEGDWDKYEFDFDNQQVIFSRNV